jgi:hypothetical protein
MAVQLGTSIQANASEIWVADFGLLSGQDFDFGKEKFVGKSYRLSPELAKSLTESLGFTAKFDAATVRLAFLDAYKNDVTLVLEMTRNTKPSDVALRYSSDRWTCLESATRMNDGLRPWRRSSYRAKSFSDQAALAICDAARIDFRDRDKFFIRVNFKDGTCGLIAPEENLGKFPGSAYSTFTLPLDQANVVRAYNEDEGKMAQVESAKLTVESLTGGNGSALKESQGAKYATYSRSEVDQLLKQQNDQLNSALVNKVASQRKEFNEALKNQEKNLAKIADELKIYSENVKKQLDGMQARKHADIDDSVDKARRELVAQIEQFKTHLNKSVLPSLKNLDDRVRTIVESTLTPTANPQGQKGGQSAMVLAAIAILIGIVNLVSLLMRH